MKKLDSLRGCLPGLAVGDACRCFGPLLRCALSGAGKSELFTDFHSPLPGHWKIKPPVTEIADTIGAICGQLAGAFSGEQGIPQEWRSRVAMGEKSRGLAEGLMGYA